MINSLKKLLKLVTYTGISTLFIYMASGPSSLIGYVALIGICVLLREVKKDNKRRNRCHDINGLNEYLSILCMGMILYFNLPLAISSILTTYFFFPATLATFAGLLAVGTILKNHTDDYPIIDQLLNKFGIGIDDLNDGIPIFFFQTLCNATIYLLFAFSIGMSYSQAATFYLTASILIETMKSLIIELIATISHHRRNGGYNVKDIMANYIPIVSYVLGVFILPTAMIKSTSSISTLSKMSLFALNTGLNFTHGKDSNFFSLFANQRRHNKRLRLAEQKLGEEFPADPLKFVARSFQ